VLLAAGGSRRLGTPKQLVRRKRRPLLLHALDTVGAAGVGPSTIVVLGAEALRLRALLRRARPPARVVLNACWRDGVASSLQTGLAAVPRSADAALVMLVDQPDISPRSLTRLIAAWRRRPRIPAAAFYSGRVGVPAILPRRSWQAVRRLRGDVGARALLREAQLTPVEMPEADFDIDTPEDLARLTLPTSSRS
jgi:molybdenum cofactor cytidylyltransferase